MEVLCGSLDHVGAESPSRFFVIFPFPSRLKCANDNGNSHLKARSGEVSLKMEVTHGGAISWSKPGPLGTLGNRAAKPDLDPLPPPASM